jgi:hypothetical protein
MLDWIEFDQPSPQHHEFPQHTRTMMELIDIETTRTARTQGSAISVKATDKMKKRSNFGQGDAESRV